MDELAIKALAKINLGLDVLRRREDGYHEVKMVMQTIHLYDQLHLKKIESGIHLETNLGFLPVDESNLAYRAARLMKEKYQIEEGIDIRLNKRIPVAAGMAGGSTDAATPLSDGQQMERSIPNAGLVVFEGCGHFSYLDDFPRFCAVLKCFWEGLA